MWGDQMYKYINNYNKEELYNLAFYDQVTDLTNEKYFYKKLSEEIKNNKNDKFAVLYLRFINLIKLINLIGYKNSNNFIKEIADKIKSFRPEIELVSLYRGSQFLIFSKINEEDKACFLMGKEINDLLNFLKNFIRQSGYSYILKSNIGVSIYPIHGKDAEAILSTTHHAMHLVDSTEDGYRIYDEKLFNKKLDNDSLKKALEKSIERKEFYLKFQPKVRIDTEKIVTVEALLRWKHPQRGEISPGRFIPMAEESGFIKNIGTWVLEESYKILKRWISLNYREIKICVNISSIELNDPEIIRKIEEISNYYTVPNNLIELEITESSFANISKGVLNKLKELGFLINLDDFGTGYSSLNYFGRFPIDILKLDKTFIDNINEWKTKALVETVINLSHRFGIEVVAEGVENKTQLNILRKLSCDYIQGYYFYKPLSIKELENLFVRKL